MYEDNEETDSAWLKLVSKYVPRVEKLHVTRVESVERELSIEFNCRIICDVVEFCNCTVE